MHTRLLAKLYYLILICFIYIYIFKLIYKLNGCLLRTYLNLPAKKLKLLADITRLLKNIQWNLIMSSKIRTNMTIWINPSKSNIFFCAKAFVNGQLRVYEFLVISIKKFLYLEFRKMHIKRLKFNRISYVIAFIMLIIAYSIIKYGK